MELDSIQVFLWSVMGVGKYLSTSEDMLGSSFHSVKGQAWGEGDARLFVFQRSVCPSCLLALVVVKRQLLSRFTAMKLVPRSGVAAVD